MILICIYDYLLGMHFGKMQTNVQQKMMEETYFYGYDYAYNRKKSYGKNTVFLVACESSPKPL